MHNLWLTLKKLDFRFGPVVGVLHQQEAGVLSPVTDPADRSLPPGASSGEQSSGT